MSDEPVTLRQLLDAGHTILLDGAMGTELDRRGASGRGEANVRDPDAVRAVHESYIEAGSDAIITNTLTMNRVFIERHRLGVDVREVNLAGARIARGAAGRTVILLGDLSSTGQLLEPYGDGSEQEATEAFKEQAGYLLEGGVDGFIIETMTDLREAMCALKACKSLSGMPVIVSIAYDTRDQGGRTIMGNAARDCACRLAEEGADAIGANCGSVDPDEMAEIVGTLAQHARLPIAAQPNAGKPRLVAGTTFYDLEPDDFARGLLRNFAAGARILGGCCGTTPAHIRAVKERLELIPRTDR